MSYLRFKYHFHYEIVPSEGIFLLSENDYFLLRGDAYIHLAPLLTGEYTEQQIIQRLKEKISLPELFYALGRLQQMGYVINTVESMPPEQAAFWDMLGVGAESAIKQLQTISISVNSFGTIDPRPFELVLRSQGIKIDNQGQYSIVLTDDYLRTELEQFNQEAIHEKRSWMLVKPMGAIPWLGPIFIPHQTGCWACLAHRLSGHRKIENYLSEKLNCSSLFPTPLATLPSVLQTVYQQATTEIAKWIVYGENPRLTGQVVSLNMLTFKQEDHILVQRPHCPVCGDPDSYTQSLWSSPNLKSRIKQFTIDGGHRHLSPQITFNNLNHHVSSITGLISNLVPLPIINEGPEPASTYVADHNFAFLEEGLYFMQEGPRGRASGKGKTDIQAKASTLCEAIERYSGVFQGNEARIKAKLSDLEGAIHPNACMLFSEKQYETYQRWNASGSRYNWVAHPFDETQEIEWTPVWSLNDGAKRYLPTAYCYYGYSRAHKSWFARADANGCAAGNSKEGAILQGFMELVERDAVALWWYNRLKRPCVDIFSFDAPYFERITYFYKKIGLKFWVLDLTSDLNIPTFAAITQQPDQIEQDITFGFGTHFDPQVALLRAVTELNQLLPHVFRKKQFKNFHDREALEWWATATLETDPYLVPDETIAPKRYQDYPQQWSNDLYTDVKSCVNIAQNKGLEILLLDQTRPDTNLHVIKVIVPGLRHFWARFAPGRLYDVPISMGWVTKPLMEHQLNPKFMFL